MPSIDKFTYLWPEKPVLIHREQELFRRLSDDPRWVAEPKWNGSRLELWRTPEMAWECWGRHGEKLAFKPDAELAEALAGLGRRLEPGKWHLFDGELRHNKTAGVRQKIVLWDVLVFGGDLLIGIPFQLRRHILRTLEKADAFASEVLTIAPQYLDHFAEAFEMLTEDEEIEGLVLKNLDGRLNLGRKSAANSGWMFKVRRPSGRYKF